MMAKMTDEDLQVLLSELRTHDLSRPQLNLLVEVVRMQQQRLTTSAKWKFRAGDRVKWTGKYGEERTGRVLKVMRKNADVQPDDDYLRWRVSLSLLERA